MSQGYTITLSITKKKNNEERIKIKNKMTIRYRRVSNKRKENNN